MLVCSVCLCLGQFCWKVGNGVLVIAVGFMIYGIGAIAMLAAYRKGSIAVLQPINSVSYVVSAILGAAFFNESFSALKVVGIIVIIVGVTILAWSGNFEDEKKCF